VPTASRSTRWRNVLQPGQGTGAPQVPGAIKRSIKRYSNAHLVQLLDQIQVDLGESKALVVTRRLGPAQTCIQDDPRRWRLVTCNYTRRTYRRRHSRQPICEP
jgi:hypothetical protein